MAARAKIGTNGESYRKKTHLHNSLKIEWDTGWVDG